MPIELTNGRADVCVTEKEVLGSARRETKWMRAVSWKPIGELGVMMGGGFIGQFLTFGKTGVVSVTLGMKIGAATC